MRRILIGAAVLVAASLAWGEVAPEAVARKEAGNVYLKHREFEKARDAYLAALQISPGFADAHYNLGVVYFFRLGDPDRALYHFTRYTRLHPDAPDLAQVKSLTVQALQQIEDRERQAYGRALEKGTVEAIQAFADQHPDSPYATDARDKIRRLEEYEKTLEDHTRAVKKAYETALAQATPEAMEDFVARYPGAPQAEEAKRLQDTWAEARSAETTAYHAASTLGTRDALEKFVDAHPRGAHVAEARVEIEHLKNAERAFAGATEAKSIQGLQRFLETYPGSPREAEARQLIDKWRLEEEEEARRIEAVRAREAREAKAGSDTASSAAATDTPSPDKADLEPAPGTAEQAPASGVASEGDSDPALKVSGSRRKLLDRYRTMIKGK